MPARNRPHDAADAAASTRGKPNTNPVRLTVNLNKEALQILDDYRENRGVTATEVIRRALTVLNFVFEAQQRGATIRVIDGDKQSDVLFV